MQVGQYLLVCHRSLLEFRYEFPSKICLIVRVCEQIGMIFDVFDVAHPDFHHIQNLQHQMIRHLANGGLQILGHFFC